MNRRILSTLLVVGLGTAGSAAAASLADAAEKHDQESLRALLKSGADVNAAQVDGTTALHWATFHNDAELVAMLIKAGANVSTSNNYGVPPLAQAAINANAEIVKLLLDAGADANTTMKGGETVLMLASRSGNADAVNALLAKGADPNKRERQGQTALMWAAAEGNLAAVQALMKGGADMNAKLDSGFTPFFFAVRQGHLAVVKEFMAAGADLKSTMQPAIGVGERARRQTLPTTPLMLAIQNGHLEVALALVDGGADPNDMSMGFTPLHIIPAIRRPDSSDISDGAPPEGQGSLSSAEFVRELVKRGADVNFRLPEKGRDRIPNTSSLTEPAGSTPFLFAADRADLPLMKLLIELGADPTIPNFNGTTPFMAAAGLGTQEPAEEAGEESESLEAVKFLLGLGADVNEVNNDGDTAVHGAAYNMYPKVIEFLAANGADPQVWSKPNKFGRTPLFIAEGFSGRLPRPDQPTIDVVTKLMVEAGLSLEGKRPDVVDIYAPKPTDEQAKQ